MGPENAITIDMRKCHFYQEDRAMPGKGNEFVDRRCIKIILASLTAQETIQAYKQFLNTPSVLVVCWRVGILTGSQLMHEGMSLYEFILTQGAKSLSRSADNTEDFFREINNALHLLFNYRVISVPKLPKSNQLVWDCVREPLIEWAYGKNKEEIEVAELNPKWTKLCESNIGLLLASHIFTYSQLKSLTKILEGDVLYRAQSPASELTTPKAIKRVLNSSIYNRIKAAGFVHTGVADISMQVINFFTERLPHPGGISYVEYALSEALTAWEVNYEEHGAGIGFFYFSQQLLKMLPLIFALRIESEKGDQWDFTQGSLASWMSQRQDETFTIEVSEFKSPPDAKSHYALARYFFSRADMGIWHVPLQGRNDAGFHWDGVSSWT